MTSAVVFAYSEVGVRCLRALLRHDVHVALVITHEDDPTEQRWFASVAELARAHQIPVLLPADPAEPAVVDAVARAQPDFLFSFYYRHMLSEQLLAIAKRGALNMHGSLLPKYRGRAPVNWAIIHGEAETGASLHYMEARPDAGPLVGQAAVAILPNDTALDVLLKVAAAAERLLDQYLPDLIGGRAPRIAQDIARGSYFGRRRPADGRISWQRPALEIHNLIRAVAPPFPGAFGSCGHSTLRALGSLYLEQAARHQQAAPCLYTESGALHVDCLDGRRLTLTVAELEGEPLTPAALLAHYGAAPVSLAGSRNNSPDGIA
jgi:methionyl-tRNA formyltransferase